MKRKGFLRALLATGLLAVVVPASHAQIFVTHLTGPNESPPNASPGIGEAWLKLNHVNDTMTIRVTFSGLLGNVTASHIHGPTALPFAGTAGVATQVPSFPGFPHGGQSGTYKATFDMNLQSSYNPSFFNASGGTAKLARQRLFNAIKDGKAYLNIHSNVFPPGEIRGFWVQAVPEPGSMALLGGLALSSVWLLRRRKRA